MEASQKREELAALVRALSPPDLAWLRRYLLRRDSAALLRTTGHLSPRELAHAESWLWERAEAARVLREKRPRLRMWLIFMLLRYAGLRLVEVFALEPTHLDWQEGLVRVQGAYARAVPLPLPVSRRLRRVLDAPGLFPPGEDALRCDASYVRRGLQQCGAACGLPKGLLSARSLRHCRALELGRQGLPLPVVDIFLGRRAGPGQNGIVRCDPQEAQRLLRQQLQRERPMKTSARNIFEGRIVTLRQSGLLVEVVLRTAGGLPVTALITDESCRVLNLKEGTLVKAGVKAPWVVIAPCADGEKQGSATARLGAENCFEAVVERVRGDGMVVEILAALSDGSQVCALHSDGQANSLSVGDKATVQFKAFSVVLNLE